jgi:hypothetical protein
MIPRLSFFDRTTQMMTSCHAAPAPVETSVSATYRSGSGWSETAGNQAGERPVSRLDGGGLPPRQQLANKKVTTSVFSDRRTESPVQVVYQASSPASSSPSSSSPPPSPVPSSPYSPAKEELLTVEDDLQVSAISSRSSTSFKSLINKICKKVFYSNHHMLFLEHKMIKIYVQVKSRLRIDESSRYRTHVRTLCTLQPLHIFSRLCF